jgi:hypothetical protein
MVQDPFGMKPAPKPIIIHYRYRHPTAKLNP